MALGMPCTQRRWRRLGKGAPAFLFQNTDAFKAVASHSGKLHAQRVFAEGLADGFVQDVGGRFVQRSLGLSVTITVILLSFASM